MPSAMIPIWIVHVIESFDFGVYVFNDNPLSGQTLVVLFFAFSKWMELAGFLRNLAFGMKLVYTQIAEIRIHHQRIMQICPDSHLVKAEIVFTSVPIADT
jgi:hypothetical protein